MKKADLSIQTPQAILGEYCVFFVEIILHSRIILWMDCKRDLVFSHHRVGTVGNGKLISYRPLSYTCGPK